MQISDHVHCMSHILKTLKSPLHALFENIIGGGKS